MDISSLKNKDYYELYDLYDKSTDDTEKEHIKDIIDERTPDINTSIFQPYPDHYDEEFNEIIYQKKEFHSNQLFLDSSATEDPCTSDFSIKPHQIVLKNFMNKDNLTLININFYNKRLLKS